MDIHGGGELMTRRHRSPRGADESGSVLVLALVFMLVVGLVVGALAASLSNDIHNLVYFKGARSSLSAAEGATQAQMSAMRSVYATTCPGTPYTLDGATIAVTCTTTVNPASSASRVITFTALGPGSKVLIVAQVTFDDFSISFNKNDCLASTPSPTTCGSGMTINSWVVTPGAG
jgi:Tfp pilus assembly protein PilX